MDFSSGTFSIQVMTICMTLFWNLRLSRSTWKTAAHLSKSNKEIIPNRKSLSHPQSWHRSIVWLIDHSSSNHNIRSQLHMISLSAGSKLSYPSIVFRKSAYDFLIENILVENHHRLCVRAMINESCSVDMIKRSIEQQMIPSLRLYVPSRLLSFKKIVSLQDPCPSLKYMTDEKRQENRWDVWGSSDV